METIESKWTERGKLMKSIFKVLFVVVVSLILFYNPARTEAATLEENLAGLKQSLKSNSWTNAALYSARAGRQYEDQAQYEKAVKLYEESAGYWEKAGQPSWGVANLIRADHIRTEIDLYIEQPKLKGFPLAKFEPESGTYLGLFLAGKLENSKADQVENAYGRKHAVYLTYTSWGENAKGDSTYFPIKFAEAAKAQGAGIQIGLEPDGGLSQVKDDEYIREFARQAKASGIPIFIRFASEMNGEWVPWYTKNGQEYIEKFRLVHDIFEEEAPNVAMVWSPNFLPRDNISKYYPGDKYVDWVGVSLYTIPYSHGEIKLGGNPIDYLLPIYETYKNKPIFISEGAISHYSFEQNKDYGTWAVGQLHNMYSYMPKMFNRVKAIHYFNLDKSTTSYDNSNNNYDIGKNPLMLSTYKRIIQHDHFIDQLTLDEPANATSMEYVKASNVSQGKGIHDAFVYVKLPLGSTPYYVAVYQDGKKLTDSYLAPWEMKINLSAIDTSKKLEVIAYDKNWKRVAQKQVAVKYENVSKFSYFSDLTEKHWAFNDINNAVNTNLITGYMGKYRPEESITAREFTAILGRSYNEGNLFDEGDFLTDSQTYMISKNFPYASTADKVLTRTQLAEIIAASQGYNLTDDDAVKYLLVNKLAQGKIDSIVSIESFDGKAPLTRAEAVRFITNVKEHGTETIQVRPAEASDPTAIRVQYNQLFD